MRYLSFQDLTSILNREESTKKLSKNKESKENGETLGTPPSSFPSCFSLSTWSSLCSREASKSYNFNLLNFRLQSVFNTCTSLCSREALNHTILTSSIETTVQSVFQHLTSLFSREASNSYDFNLLNRDYSLFSTPIQASALGRLQIIQF